MFTELLNNRKLFLSKDKEEILNYVKSGEPRDKAGAYAIQGNAASFVESLEGSYSNVVGLPLELVKKLIDENGWQIARSQN